MKEKIKELFVMLSRADQLELLRELTSTPEINNPVIKVGEISQIQYGQNITFSVTNLGNDGNPQIHVRLTAPWGVFEYTAINQKIAKAKAAEIALIELNEQLENKK